MHIGHFMTGIWAEGGVASYIRRIGEAQVRAGQRVTYLDLQQYRRAGAVTQDVHYLESEHDLYRTAAALQLDVLHLHGQVRVGPAPGTVPTVRTIHNHDVYCPSGTRYFQMQDRPCPRAFSIAGCLCGHYLNRCGSLRPNKVLEGFRRVRSEQRVLAGMRSITNSEFVRQQMLRSGYDPERIRTLLLPGPSATEAPPLHTDDTPRFLFLGRIVPEKGVLWLIEAVAQVRRPIHLDIAGDGRQMGEVRDLITRRGLAERISLHGWVDQTRAFALLRMARAVVFPSVWHEPAGLVTLEAAAHARAVIASRVGGIPEYAQQLGNTILVDVANRQDLAGAIERLAEDVDLARQLGQTGLRNVLEKFSVEQHIRELTGIYAGLTSA